MAELVAGVDGCKGGWVAVVLGDGRLQDVRLIDGVCSEFKELADVQRIVIDIPIGFGPRDADGLARELVGGSTVFPIPEEAKFEGEWAAGRGISKQTFVLGPRIRHVTDLAVRDQRFREAHPEVCFYAMNGGRRLDHRSKKSAGGAFERIDLLRKQGMNIEDLILGPGASVALDDLLDAAACAWTAARKSPVSLPDPPETRDGLKIAIWY